MTTHPSTVSDVDAIQRFAALCRHFGVVPRTEETRREGKADPVTDLFLSVKDTAAFVTAANAIRKETGWEKPDYLSAWERWPDLGHQSVATIKRRFDEIIALTRTENSNVPTFTHTSLWAHFAQQPTILAADFAKVDRKLADTAAILKATHEHAPISKADLWFAYLNAPVAFKRNPAVIATRLSDIYQRYLDGRFPCEGETPASAL